MARLLGWTCSFLSDETQIRFLRFSTGTVGDAAMLARSWRLDALMILERFKPTVLLAATPEPNKMHFSALHPSRLLPAQIQTKSILESL